MLSSAGEPQAGPAEAEALDPMADLVRRIQSGIDVDRNFEELYKHFHPRMMAYLSSRGVEAGLCEDLTQETFIRVSRSIGSFEHRSRFARWVFEILKKVLLNEVRRVRTAKRDGVEMPIEEEVGTDVEERRDAASPLVAGGPSAYEEMERREQRAALHRAVATLPPQMQRCVVLRLYQDRKYSEIARVMRISIDAVKAHLGQGRVRLQKMLAECSQALGRLEDDESEVRE